MVLDLWGRLRPFWESGESHGLSFKRSAKFTSPLLGPERSISVLHFAPNEGRKLMVTSNSVPGIKHSIYSVNLLRKTGLSTNSKPEALGLWVSLQAALVKAVPPYSIWWILTAFQYSAQMSPSQKELLSWHPTFLRPSLSHLALLLLQKYLLVLKKCFIKCIYLFWSLIRIQTPYGQIPGIQWHLINICWMTETEDVDAGTN